MIDGKSVLAIIPARGGSKGLPRKNILPLAGKPLIAWTIEAAKISKYIDRIIVSTEDNEIADISKFFGAETPFIRPKFLAQDKTQSMDVVLHAINKVSGFDYILLLQPTSPLRTATDIDESINLCLNQNAPACVSVVTVAKSPYWMYKIDNHLRLKPIIKGKSFSRRQDLPPSYTLNGAIYFASVEWLLNSKQFITEHTIAFEMPMGRSVDIDNDLDYKYVQFLLNND